MVPSFVEGHTRQTFKNYVKPCEDPKHKVPCKECGMYALDEGP